MSEESQGVGRQKMDIRSGVHDCCWINLFPDMTPVPLLKSPLTSPTCPLPTPETNLPTLVVDGFSAGTWMWFPTISTGNCFASVDAINAILCQHSSIPWWHGDAGACHALA